MIIISVVTGTNNTIVSILAAVFCFLVAYYVTQKRGKRKQVKDSAYQTFLDTYEKGTTFSITKVHPDGKAIARISDGSIGIIPEHPSGTVLRVGETYVVEEGFFFNTKELVPTETYIL